MLKLHYYSLMLAASCSCGSVLAQSSNETSNDDLEEIVVKVNPLLGNGSAQAFQVLSGDELAEKTQGSLGATIAQEAGIHSASFGAAVGRPVIHGLGQARVKVTEDRIDSLDVSVTSTDHAVTVEPFIANQISILKGASTLLYGAGAIGGVVDVETGRIPTALTGKPISGRVELRATDDGGGDGETGAFRLDGETAGGFAWHVDGFSKEADDYEIPGDVASSQFSESSPDVAEELGDDVLNGSFVDVQGGSIGASYIFDRGFVGLSVSRTEGDYGLIPNGFEEEEEGGAEEGEEEEGPGFIDLEQTRVDLEGQLEFASSLIEKVNVRFGINDYEHVEFEAPGEQGTVFENDAWEGRVEFTHAPVFGFDGVFGLQLNDREFSAVGEEAFVQPVDSDRQAVFWAGERSFSEKFELEAGLRYEQVDFEPTGVDEFENAFEDSDFSTVSASLGGVFHADEKLQFSALLDYSERAPTIEELFSNGPHIATLSFEIGDPDLDEEQALGLTFTGQYNFSRVNVSASVYFIEFDDFIYQASVDENFDGVADIEDGLTVLRYLQDDASFAGIDLKAGFGIARLGQGNLDGSLLFDIVEAEIDVVGNDNLPRIPATRFGAGLNWSSENWDVKVDYVRVRAQDDVADFELESDAYNDVSLRVSRSFAFGGDSNLNLFIQGRNLTDDDQRNHVSFVKDFAPAPGRTFEIGARYSF